VGNAHRAFLLLAIAGATLVARDAQGAPSQKNVVFILTTT